MDDKDLVTDHAEWRKRIRSAGMNKCGGRGRGGRTTRTW